MVCVSYVQLMAQLKAHVKKAKKQVGSKRLFSAYICSPWICTSLWHFNCHSSCNWSLHNPETAPDKQYSQTIDMEVTRLSRELEHSSGVVVSGRSSQTSSSSSRRTQPERFSSEDLRNGLDVGATERAKIHASTVRASIVVKHLPRTGMGLFTQGLGAASLPSASYKTRNHSTSTSKMDRSDSTHPISSDEGLLLFVARCVVMQQGKYSAGIWLKPQTNRRWSSWWHLWSNSEGWTSWQVRNFR